MTAGAELQSPCARRCRLVAVHSLWLLAGLCIARQGAAQELEPRAYSASPIGLNFLTLSATHSTGDVLLDPSTAVTDVDAHIDASVLGYGHTFGLLGHAANVAIAVPYLWGKISGNVGADEHEVHRSGLGDPQLRIAVNLVGDPALTPREFASRTPQTTLGISLTVVPPLGQYEPTQLINIGANRWAVKPQLGVSYPTGAWFIEGYAGVWLFTDNPNYYGGARREQEPVGTLQSHISYTFRPRLWLAFDLTYYAGGRTAVNGVYNEDRQSNSRVGLTLSLPAGGRQSVKLTWSRGATVRVGGDFTTVGATWQYSWFD